MPVPPFEFDDATLVDELLLQLAAGPDDEDEYAAWERQVLIDVVGAVRAAERALALDAAERVRGRLAART